MLALLALLIFLSSHAFSQLEEETEPVDIEEERVEVPPSEEAEPEIEEEMDFLPQEAELEFQTEPLELTAEELELEVPEELEGLEFLEEEEVIEIGEIEKTRVNLIFQEANVTDILGALAQQTGLNIIWGDEVGGIVSLRLENVPWDQALEMVLKANKLTYEQEGNIIRVTTIARLNEEREAELKLQEAEKEKEPLVTKILTLNFSNAKEVKASVDKVLSKRGNIVVDERTNSLVITEIGSNLEEVERVAMAIDTQTPQVMIEARIVETSVSLVQDLGIDWTLRASKLVPSHWKNEDLDGLLDKLVLPAKSDSDEDIYDWLERRAEKRYEITHRGGQLDSQFPTTGAYDGTAGTGGLFRLGVLDAYDFEIAWQAIETDGDTKILSNPRVATLHNKQAKILVGEKIPIQQSEVTESGTSYTVEFEDVGTTLEVTATINKDDMVTLRIHPEVSEIGYWKQLAVGEYPVITTKEADVEVLVKSGDTVVIGGLIYEKEIKSESKIPIIGDIPLIGWAFKKRKTEKEDQEILVAGCGTSQAAKYALRQPAARMVGIDVSSTSLRHTKKLKRTYNLANLDLHQLPIERVHELEGRFDQIICTGVLHHLADPDAALTALRSVLKPNGAMHLMVYAPYGRTGITMLQEYEREAWQIVLAGVVTVMIPTLALFVIANRQLIRGLTAGALKG